MDDEFSDIIEILRDVEFTREYPSGDEIYVEAGINQFLMRYPIISSKLEMLSMSIRKFLDPIDIFENLLDIGPIHDCLLDFHDIYRIYSEKYIHETGVIRDITTSFHRRKIIGLWKNYIIKSIRLLKTNRYHRSMCGRMVEDMISFPYKRRTKSLVEILNEGRCYNKVTERWNYNSSDYPRIIAEIKYIYSKIKTSPHKVNKYIHRLIPVTYIDMIYRDGCSVSYIIEQTNLFIQKCYEIENFDLFHKSLSAFVNAIGYYVYPIESKEFMFNSVIRDPLTYEIDACSQFVNIEIKTGKTYPKTVLAKMMLQIILLHMQHKPLKKILLLNPATWSVWLVDITGTLSSLDM